MWPPSEKSEGTFDKKKETKISGTDIYSKVWTGRLPLGPLIFL